MDEAPVALTNDLETAGPQLPPCLDDLGGLAAEHPGVLCVTVPEPGSFDFAYDASRMSRGEVREFIDHAAPVLEQHLSRCTMPLHGRACETCALRIQDRIKNIPGISHATASYAPGSLVVTFDRSVMTTREVVDRIKSSGVSLETSQRFLSVWHRVLRALDSQRGQSVMVGVAGVALIAGFVLNRTAPDSILPGIAWLTAYISGGYSGVRATIRSLRVGAMDIDLLMVLAALGAAVIGAPAEGAVLLFLFALSNLLQAYAVGRARKAVAALLDLRPEMALVKQNGELVSTPVAQVAPGQVIVLRPGERVPMDGEVIAGAGTINQAAVTGESMPVEKQPGDPVFTGTMNQEGSLEVRVTRMASESTLARMISLVESAQGEKAHTQRFLERAEQYYAGGVIAFTLLLIAVPPLLGQDFSSSFYRAMAVMVVASPCALILSTPAAILSAIAGLGRRGILVKGGRHMEEAAGIRAVALDKTGTLTAGKPQVTDVVPVGDGKEGNALSENELLALAAQAEMRSEHPLAKAVIDEAKSRGIDLPQPTDFSSITGRGGQARLANGDNIVFGSLKLMHERKAARYDELATLVHRLEHEGKTVICVARQDGDNTMPLGVLSLQDVVRPDALEAIKALRRLGIQRIVMLTGDSQGVADAIAAQAGITEVHAALMPEDKVRVIKELAAETPVIMVGDGINDAPALAAANLGMAMGAAGTDVAMETADVVLMSHDLQQIPNFLELSKKARRIVLQNLVFASAVVVVLLIAALGFNLPLTLGVVGHEGSTVLVCLNGLRLLRGPRAQ